MASTSPGRSDQRPSTRPSRRRQRSVRVTVAVALLSFATLVVILALPTGSVAWMGAASVFSLLCGWAAARIIYNELTESRRHGAADRAAQANAYRTMFSTRAVEHASFTTAMTDRLAKSDREVRELSGTMVQAEQRAAEAEHRVKREAKRANDLEAKVTELEEELAIREAEDADQLATWDGASLFDQDLESVVDLVAWEERAGEGSAVPRRKRA